MIGFWIFMVIIDMLIPLTMIIFGKRFMQRPPGDINCVSGYRTTMSMKNADTWAFAHHYCGRIWYVTGIVMILPSLLPFFICYRKRRRYCGNGGWDCLWCTVCFNRGNDLADGAGAAEAF